MHTHKFMWIILLLFPVSSTKAEIPGCDYFDTVKLSESKRFPNGSYLYDKVIIPPEETGEYDYEILRDGEKMSVPKHLRGCACKFGNCIKFCCQRNLMLVDNERRCSENTNITLEYDPYVVLTLHDGSKVRRHILDEMIIQEDLPVPCSSHFVLNVSDDEGRGWTLLEDGSLQFESDKVTISKQKFCLQPQVIKNGDGDPMVNLEPHYCADIPPSPWPATLLFPFSIFGMILTVAVYLWLPKLRNLHGICFICYLLCLLVVFSLLLSNLWNGNTSVTVCQLHGYIGYFACMAGFLWLTVISYDLWNSFRLSSNSLQQYSAKYRFGIYSIYVWGIAAILTIIVMVADSTLDPDNPDHVPWIPGVAIYSCWIKTDDWSAMLYFYGPMSLQIIFNLIMFILTALRILKVMKELQTIVTRQERQQRLNSDKKTYGLFVRLFVIMGVTWTFEILSYLSQSNGVLKIIFTFFDYINEAQGVIIFVMFVLKRSVLKLISDRFHHRQQNSQSIALSSKSSYLRSSYVKNSPKANPKQSKSTIYLMKKTQASFSA